MWLKKRKWGHVSGTEDRAAGDLADIGGKPEGGCIYA